MLERFFAWANRVAGERVGKDFSAQVFESKMSDNPSARLDIDTSTAVARATFWSSGEYDAEVISVETGLTIFSAHGNVQNESQFSDAFADFFRSLER